MPLLAGALLGATRAPMPALEPARTSRHRHETVAFVPLQDAPWRSSDSAGRDGKRLDGRAIEGGVAMGLELDREVGTAGADDPPAGEDVHLVGDEVVEKAPVVSDDQRRAVRARSVLTPAATTRSASMSRPESVSSSTARRGSSISIWRISWRLRSPPENPSLTARSSKARSIPTRRRLASTRARNTPAAARSSGTMASRSTPS
jgi:hypothetical protein